MDDRPDLRSVLIGALDEPLEALDEERRRGRRRGRRVRNALWTARTRMQDLVHDRRTDTTGIEYDAEHVHPERVRYEPSGWDYLARALRPADVGPEDVFVDFGSGKGRVVLQAARYPFARVIGVEISPRLTEIARANVERVRPRLRCGDLSLVTADAAAFPIPPEMTVGYFFYPFTGDTFERVIANVVRSLDAHPRRVRLVYAAPRLEQVILGTGRFTRTRTSSGGWADPIGRRVSLYDTGARPAAP